MNASQLKRIRAKLATAERLTAEAHEIAKSGHADSTLRETTARAADDMRSAGRALQQWDDQNRAMARSLARSLEESRRQP